MAELGDTQVLLYLARVHHKKVPANKSNYLQVFIALYIQSTCTGAHQAAGVRCPWSQLYYLHIVALMHCPS